jgi:hypothetical protein
MDAGTQNLDHSMNRTLFGSGIQMVQFSKGLFFGYKIVQHQTKWSGFLIAIPKPDYYFLGISNG